MEIEKYHVRFSILPAEFNIARSRDQNNVYLQNIVEYLFFLHEIS